MLLDPNLLTSYWPSSTLPESEGTYNLQNMEKGETQRKKHTQIKKKKKKKKRIEIVYNETRVERSPSVQICRAVFKISRQTLLPWQHSFVREKIVYFHAFLKRILTFSLIISHNVPL